MHTNTTFLCVVLVLFASNGSLAAQQLESLWDDLSSREAPRAYRAVWSLTGSGDRAVQLLKERLRPQMGDPQRLRKLIAELDDRRFAVREAASRDLGRLGLAAAPALRDALRNDPSPEVRTRVNALLSQLTEPSPLASSAEELRTVRAIQVLEYIATDAAKELLRTLASGIAGARATDDARAALARLSRSPTR